MFFECLSYNYWKKSQKILIKLTLNWLGNFRLFEVFRVRLVRPLGWEVKFEMFEVRVFKVRSFWVRSNTIFNHFTHEKRQQINFYLQIFILKFWKSIVVFFSGVKWVKKYAIQLFELQIWEKNSTWCRNKWSLWYILM